MARFKYVGDHEETYVFDRWFRKGKAIDVPEDGYVAKLRGNSHFEEVKTRRKTQEVLDVDPDEQ